MVKMRMRESALRRIRTARCLFGMLEMRWKSSLGPLAVCKDFISSYPSLIGVIRHAETEGRRYSVSTRKTLVEADF